MPSLQTSNKSSFTFHSDIPSYETSRSGMLHATKKTTGSAGSGSVRGSREDHAFAWLDDRHHASVDNVISHLVEFGFEECDMVFIPYSKVENWVHRYPHACPYMECDSNGNISGVPYFHQYINADPGQANTQSAITGSPPKASKSNQSNKKQKSKSKAAPPKVVPSANLSNLERSQLHIEIYNYFLWLHSELADMDKSSAGRSKLRRAGISSLPGIQNLITKMENTFRHVKDYKDKREAENNNNIHQGGGEEAEAEAEAEASTTINNNGKRPHAQSNNDGNAGEGDSGNNSEKENAPPAPLPMLERNLGEDLRSLIPAAAQKQGYGPRRNFDALFERLLAYKEEKGHLNVRNTYKEDDGVNLGRWVEDVRKSKRALRARGLEYEPPNPNNVSVSGEMVTLPVPPGQLGLTIEFRQISEDSNLSTAVITEIAPECSFRDEIAVGDRLMTIDGVPVTSFESLEVGKDREKRMFGIASKIERPNRRVDTTSSTFLSQERVERLDGIGFLWESPHKEKIKSWEERYKLLIQYKEERGVWPKRSETWEGLGEWMHTQRRFYKKNDEKFMKKRVPKLNEINFPWGRETRGASEPISWEDNYERLVEFVRVNGHCDVPRPQTQDTEEDESAMRFYRWIQQQHIGYKAYVVGKRQNVKKPTAMREDKIHKLLELGFPFKEPQIANSKSEVVEVAFEKRLEQLQTLQDELGHMKIDFRYGKIDNLGGWCAQVSQRYKDWQEGTLSITSVEEDQFNQLRDIGFEFNVFAQARDRRSWEENFEAFMEFQQAHGHSNVPQRYKGDMRLGVWVSMQRDEYKALSEGKKSKLTQERYDKLDKAGFIWEKETGGDNENS